MRALSWKQPFAALMSFDKIETRIWETDYRGPVLICASAGSYSYNQINKISGNMSERTHKAGILGERRAKMFELINIKAMAISVGNLVDCYEMRPEDEAKCFVKYQTPWYITKVNKMGRIIKIKKCLWCHVYEDVKLIEPIPWKGKLGWQTLSPEFIAKIKYL